MARVEILYLKSHIHFFGTFHISRLLVLSSNASSNIVDVILFKVPSLFTSRLLNRERPDDVECCRGPVNGRQPPRPKLFANAKTPSMVY